MALALTGTPPITAAALDAAVNTELATNWFPLAGTIAGGNAAAGTIGEYISAANAYGSAVMLTALTPANIVSISLTAGDWDVWGTFGMNNAASTVRSFVSGGISTASSTLPTAPAGGGFAQNVAAVTNDNSVLPVGLVRLSLSSTTTVYLVVESNFTTSSSSAFGFIGARRVR